MEAAGSVKEGETESGASTAPLQNRDIIEKRCPPVAAVTLDELRSMLSRLRSARLVLPGAATAPPPGLVAQRSVLAQGPCMQSKEGSLRTRGSLAWSAGATACPTIAPALAQTQAPTACPTDDQEGPFVLPHSYPKGSLRATRHLSLITSGRLSWWMNEKLVPQA